MGKKGQSYKKLRNWRNAYLWKNQTITEAQEERTWPDSVHLFTNLIILYFHIKPKQRKKKTNFQVKSHQIVLNEYVFSFLATH